MSDRFSGSYDVLIDAPPNMVAEFCRDPRGIFAGEFDFSQVNLTPGVVGTTARGASKGSGLEQMMIEYVAFVADQQVVFNVYPKMTIPKLGWVISFPTHVLTWTFTAEDGGTRLRLDVVELDPPRWERLLDVAFQRSWAKLVRARLGRIKTAAEDHAASAH